MADLNKIVGFLITKDHNAPNYDLFNVGLNCLDFKIAGLHLFIWGIGDISKCLTEKGYSLSYPESSNLLDRNVLLNVNNECIVIENDWLGSIPVFYNEKECIISSLSPLCLKNKEVDLEGLKNYCLFGYSVLEKTPFKSVRFLRYFSKLTVKNNELTVEYKKDPALDDDFISRPSCEVSVVQKMKEYISEKVEMTNGDVVLPISGGYDSRILSYLVKDKSRIKSYTYGISEDQSQSFEVVHAKKISHIFNIDWKHIELKDFNKHIASWFSAYGFSAHLHGMYHIEFYTKILEPNNLNNPVFLSGIVGDCWAESGKFKPIDNHNDVAAMGYSHGMSLDENHLAFSSDGPSLHEFYDEFKVLLSDERIRAIFVIRKKLILLSYLTQIPEYFGIPVFTPYLNLEIVRDTLNIRKARRVKRLWQSDLFRKVGLNLEDMNLKSKKSNKLDYKIGLASNFEKIDVSLTKPYFKFERLEEINNLIATQPKLVERLKNELLYVPKVGGLLRRIGCSNKRLRAQYDYKVIKAFEIGLKL